MAYQSVFKRYETKFLLGKEQTDAVLDAMEGRMALDSHGLTTIRNIYLDTGNYLLARRSIEKPLYKEKIRIRSYSEAGPEDMVFVELKKKYDSVVYKRRAKAPLGMTLEWLCDEGECPDDSQIMQEIDFFAKRYGDLRPAMSISYSRRAYYPVDNSGVRITLDQNICADDKDIRLDGPVSGLELLEEGCSLMEVKTGGNIPMWLVKTMEMNDIKKTSYSKYGDAYRRMVYPYSREELSASPRTEGCQETRVRYPPSLRNTV